jgi:acetyl-CoA carboxylase biotin carboxyl carrier protein
MLSMKEIRELVELVTERGLAAAMHAHPAATPGPRTAEAAAVPEIAAVDENVHVITSPIVGTFYRSPSPESDPFAEIGQRIGKGKILCIIESMKLMNEIESDVEGEVVAVYPRNGQPVEYGEKLFAIRLAA